MGGCMLLSGWRGIEILKHGCMKCYDGASGEAAHEALGNVANLV